MAGLVLLGVATGEHLRQDVGGGLVALRLFLDPQKLLLQLQYSLGSMTVQGVFHLLPRVLVGDVDLRAPSLGASFQQMSADALRSY